MNSDLKLRLEKLLALRRIFWAAWPARKTIP